MALTTLAPCGDVIEGVLKSGALGVAALTGVGALVIPPTLDTGVEVEGVLRSGVLGDAALTGIGARGATPLPV